MGFFFHRNVNASAMKILAKLLLPLFFLPFAAAIAQTDDSRQLYDDSGLGRVDITIDSVSLKWIYANVQSDSEHAATFRFRNGTVDETVDSVGFRLRGNTSRAAKKKSFKVSFNTFTKGGRFHGVKGMNLNGEHNDPSLMRSKLSFDLFRDAGIPAPRANHVRVYINGAYYGLYVSVEHIDDEFLHKYFADDTGNLWKCLWPADLRYLGPSQADYKALKNSPTTPAYELKKLSTQFKHYVSIKTHERLLLFVLRFGRQASKDHDEATDESRSRSIYARVHG